MYCFLFVKYRMYIFFFKQKTADEMRISDWSSDVCSSDLESLMRPFQMFSRCRDFIFPQRRTMHVMRTGLVGRAITNRCITSDQRRAWIGGCFSECTPNVGKIMAIA